MSYSTSELPQLHYQTSWSEYQQRYIATVSRFPSLTVLASNPDEALGTLQQLVQAILDRRGEQLTDARS